MKKINVIIAVLLNLLIACNEEQSITKREDYFDFLDPEKITLVSDQKEIRFWEDRLRQKKDDDVSMLKLAGLFVEEFKSNGEISFLKKSDSLYNIVLNRTPFDKASIYQSLAANAITQHKFREAEKHITKALMIGDQKATSKLMLADVSIELGAYDWAQRILKDFKNKNSFAWLIRKAKLKDHEGDLDSAIILMERAYERIEGNKSLACWTLSNLGDMYGHAGRIEQSYKNYLKVLELNPDDDYCLKGIAWIALSHDHKFEEAHEIIEFLSKKNRMPEAHLMLAEIAAGKGDEQERIHQLTLFKSMVDIPPYRLMYNKYLAQIEAEDFQRPDKCIEIANQEVKNRPTPQSFDLLAWGYYLKGDSTKALEIGRDYVENQTFEPDALYHLGVIYKSNGFVKQGDKLLEEAHKSSFELGPSVTKAIERALM